LAPARTILNDQNKAEGEAARRAASVAAENSVPWAWSAATMSGTLFWENA